MTTTELLVGLDVGTTATKAVVFDSRGVTIAHGRATTPWHSVSSPPVAGSGVSQGSELRPAELLRAALTALSRALADAPDGPVVGLGITSMGESGVLLDSHGAPLGPVIAWHDNRDVGQVTRLERDLGAETFSARTGLPLRSQWSLTKHRWQLDNEPAVAGATTRLNIAEWIVACLGGDRASDASLASRTGWLDLAERNWWSEALDWSGASASLLAPLVTSGTALGRVSTAAGIERLAGAVLTTAGHDHQAATVGADAAGPGDQLDSCGTAEALVRTVPAPFPAAGVSRLAQRGITVGWHVLDGHWALLGATQGGLVLGRVLRLLGGREALASLDAAAIDAAAIESVAIESVAIKSVAQTVVVEIDDLARVTVAGIGDEVTAGHVWRATLEAVTDQIAQIHTTMTSVVGPHRTMVVTGGWSGSSALLDIRQRAFGNFSRPEVEEAGARGAALLAGLAAGTYSCAADFPRLSVKLA